MTRKELLKIAESIVSGKREGVYGSPEDNFSVIADLWSVYTGTKIAPADVVNMMILLKVARNASGNYCADNYVDIAGYAACGGEIASKNR